VSFSGVTVNVVSGGSISTNTGWYNGLGVSATNTSIVNLLGGSISTTSAGYWAQSISATNNSTVNFSDGTMTTNGIYGDGYGIYTDGSTVNVSGGTMSTSAGGYHGWGITAVNNSAVTISGGTMTTNGIYGDGYGIYTDGSTVTISGGTMSTSAGGYNGWGVYATDNSTVYILGGTVSTFNTWVRSRGVYVENSTAYISGGTISAWGSYADAIYANNNGRVDISGGSFSSQRASPWWGSSCDITASNNSVINIYGTGFNYGFGPISDTSGTLTGTLADGTSINLTFLRTQGGEIVLASEPSQNNPPEAQPAPSYQVVEIGIDPIVVAADVADSDGDMVTYQWLKGSEVLASGSVQTTQDGTSIQIPDLVIPAGDTRFVLGVHQIELKVSDGVNTPQSVFVSVEVTDTAAPTLAPVPSVTILWPPNHELQPVTIAANAFDNGGGVITLGVMVQSSEPTDAAGDGSTIPDYYIDSVDDQTGFIQLRLRSERAGTGDGRTYKITITATDASGNNSVSIVEIRAPHDRRKK
jgi:hypothetical protein